MNVCSPDALDTATGRYLVVLGDNRGLTASALPLHSDLQIVSLKYEYCKAIEYEITS